ncbi:hypothetical protein P152DRAFT_112645 [Eremomyces bilateralis CBS 781.70]|uniref:Uncharacterized protein n=1 Tax=Eremomyces bilateralis CBS 781.70 TaxID=1392243 RepID=A0A6G1GDP3_9PEZI|nr:uncharacterized protein P152DRAFT_112645 [Eremomyces bilateralis CBS 781.70]KAF1816163.1 hypothetical protein P152DRAFT_112645 [Eremomyces bilateralis CBS 781.70]
MRLQFPLGILIHAYTATRPGAILYGPSHVPGEEPEPWYTEFNLTDLNPTMRDLFYIDVDLQWTKGVKRHGNRKIFILTESTVPMLCPVFHILGIAIIDGALEGMIDDASYDFLKIFDMVVPCRFWFWVSLPLL